MKAPKTSIGKTRPLFPNVDSSLRTIERRVHDSSPITSFWMKHPSKSRMCCSLGFLVSLLFLFTREASAGWDYGNGRHGSYVLRTNSTIEQLYQAVRLSNDPAQYDAKNTNAIPNFQQLIITDGGTLTANPWNGSEGGWIVLKVQATLAVTPGSAIAANGIGFRGGGTIAAFGESFTIRENPQFGGGVESLFSFTGNTVTGAGGGGYGSPGGNGSCFTYNGASFCSSGGATYGDAALSVVFLGSGGGTAGQHGISGAAQKGGNGGGAIVIEAGNLVVDGQIQANGVGGGPGEGGAGGGSGGSIRLQTVSSTLGDNRVTAIGGIGGIGTQNNGGRGGEGRIVVGYVQSYTGATTPAALTILDVSSDNITTIRRQPVSQTRFLSSTAVIDFDISGYAPFAFQWYFNGSAITDGTNQVLTLKDLTFSNQGSYSVVVSNAVMSISSSNAFLTVYDGRDLDSDGIPNYWEQLYGLDPSNPGDALRSPNVGGQVNGLSYLQVYLHGLNPLTLDSDSDGVSDYDELFIFGTNPSEASTLGDGIPDGWKVGNGLNPLTSRANDEIGMSGVTYQQVYQYSTNSGNSLKIDPRSPFSVSGMPGMSIFEILNKGQHTNRFYYDKNDRLTGAEYSKGVAISYRYDGNGNITNQAVIARASETNGLPVLWLLQHGLPNRSGIPYEDSDGDGWTNYQEWKAGTDPVNPNSMPSVFTNPGESIALQQWPFVPSNFVAGTGQLDGFGADAIVVSADGQPGSKTNFALILTQEAVGWSSQRIDVGSSGVTSIAIGQLASRTNPAIYLGLRGSTSGQIVEFVQSGGIWQSNILTTSTNDTAYVLGVRSGAELLASFSTNEIDAGLFSLSFANNAWKQTVLSTNRGNGLQGTHGTVWSRMFRDTSVRMLDDGQMELIAADREALKNNLLLPTNWVYNPTTSKFYFQSTNTMSRDDGETLAQQYGSHLATIADAAENFWAANQFEKPYWIGLYMEARCCSIDLIFGTWSSSGSFGGSNTRANAWDYYWSVNPFFNFEGNAPFPRPNGVCVGLGGNAKWTCKLPGNQYRALIDATGVQTFSNRWVIAPTTPSRLTWKANQFAMARIHPDATNESSLVACFIADRDGSGSVSALDDFVLAEYRISGDQVTLKGSSNNAVGSGAMGQSFGVVALDFLKAGSDCILTAEPSGKLYAYFQSDTAPALQRTLFSDAYTGSAWHAMAGLKMSEGGEGLIGLRTTTQSSGTCEVVFWSPQPTLPIVLDVPQSPPVARLLPSPNAGGNLADVSIRVWDLEGNSASVELQYKTAAVDWRAASLVSSTNFPASPEGVSRALIWNALKDLQESFAGAVMLRVRANDSNAGPWSEAMPYDVRTTTPPPAIVLDAQFVAGALVIRWSAPTGISAILETSPAVTGPEAEWQSVGVFQPGLAEYRLTPLLDEPTRFFRLRLR